MKGIEGKGINNFSARHASMTGDYEADHTDGINDHAGTAEDHVGVAGRIAEGSQASPGIGRIGLRIAAGDAARSNDTAGTPTMHSIRDNPRSSANKTHSWRVAGKLAHDFLGGGTSEKPDKGMSAPKVRNNYIDSAKSRVKSLPLTRIPENSGGAFKVKQTNRLKSIDSYITEKHGKERRKLSNRQDEFEALRNRSLSNGNVTANKRRTKSNAQRINKSSLIKSQQKLLKLTGNAIVITNAKELFQNLPKYVPIPDMHVLFRGFQTQVKKYGIDFALNKLIDSIPAIYQLPHIESLFNELSPPNPNNAPYLRVYSK